MLRGLATDRAGQIKPRPSEHLSGSVHFTLITPGVSMHYGKCCQEQDFAKESQV